MSDSSAKRLQGLHTEADTHNKPQGAVESADLTLTVVEAASIIEADSIESVYRYDLPAASIRESWGIAALWEQCRDSLGIGDDKFVVHLIAEPDIRDLLTIHAEHYGVEILPEYDTEEFFEEESPQASGKIFDWGMKAVVAAIAVLTISVCVWATVKTEPSVASAPPIATSEQDSASATSELQEYSYQGVVTKLPSGFVFHSTLEDPNVVVATGPTEDFRVLIAKDSLVGMGAEDVLAELRQIIVNDASLENIDPLIERGNALSYNEIADDGAHTRWLAWVEKDYLFSVGCQTRQAMSVPQQALCRAAHEYSRSA